MKRGTPKYDALMGLVDEAYKNARENGYGDDLDGMNPDQVAQDMCDCNADLERYDVDDVAMCVGDLRKRWRQGK